MTAHDDSWQPSRPRHGLHGLQRYASRAEKMSPELLNLAIQSPRIPPEMPPKIPGMALLSHKTAWPQASNPAWEAVAAIPDGIVNDGDNHGRNRNPTRTGGAHGLCRGRGRCSRRITNTATPTTTTTHTTTTTTTTTRTTTTTTGHG